MADLPGPLLELVYSLAIESRSPAFLLVAKDGRLLAWGGEVEAYGLGDLHKGEEIGAQVFFLEGLLPLQDGSLLLPCVQTGPGSFADMYLGGADEGDWVLLLDATADEAERRRMQQKANDLSLLRGKLSGSLGRYAAGGFLTPQARQVFDLAEEGERREVAVLSALIQGVGDYGEKNAPACVLKTLNRYRRALDRSIHNEAGLAEKAGGDIFTALFGVLPTSAPAAVQAIQSAFDMLDSVRAVNQTQQQQPAFELGIGIAAGAAVVGFVEGRAGAELSMVGRPADIAADLKRRARRGEILIDAPTFAASERFQSRFSVHSPPDDRPDEPVQIFSCRADR
jgi:class 3 adenylate cyclase